MYDQSFTEKTLSQILKPVDFFKVKDLNLKKEDIIKDSITRVMQGFEESCLPNEILKLNIIKKNNTYKLSIFSDELALRKASKNIKVKSKIKQLNRNLIIENLITLLSENVQYKIYRLDINKFYDSVNINDIIDDLKSDLTISRQTVILISSFFNIIKNQVNGLPRGIFLSSILAERTLKFFDDTVKNNPDVFFYSRFVDDIIIISSGDENEEFLNEIKNTLNKKNLSLNENKGYEYKFEKNKNEDSDFEYLGYKITIKSYKYPEKFRSIEVDIATKKIKKIKTKIIKSLLDYCKKQDFSILLDRIKFLTGNYNLIDKKTKTTKKAGIFYSYNYITSYSALNELDSFLKKAILSNSGAVFCRFSLLISTQEKKELLKYKFSSGFSDKKFYYFNARRYSEITKAWNYE